MVFDNFLVTTSLTLLRRLLAEMALELVSDWPRSEVAMSEPSRFDV